LLVLPSVGYTESRQDVCRLCKNRSAYKPTTLKRNKVQQRLDDDDDDDDDDDSTVIQHSKIRSFLGVIPRLRSNGMSPSRHRSSIGYEFTASSGYDYNYDPVDGRSSLQIDPYSNDYPPSDDYPRPRSSTPPQTSPSPSYMLESTKPSIPLTDPSSSRKLLILDLNGTLVFRSSHRPRPARRPFHRPYNGYDAPRALRTAYPRPYMSSFTSYLFHPTTRSWLDTMIWSSAQPHSVADMVNRCFGNRKDELVAVWARDTLGLEQKDYSASSFLSYKQAVLLIYISYRSKNPNDKRPR
jgi:NLI interacting factor-like phosphatase